MSTTTDEETSNSSADELREEEILNRAVACSNVLTASNDDANQLLTDLTDDSTSLRATHVRWEQYRALYYSMVINERDLLEAERAVIQYRRRHSDAALRPFQRFPLAEFRRGRRSALLRNADTIVARGHNFADDAHAHVNEQLSKLLAPHNPMQRDSLLNAVKTSLEHRDKAGKFLDEVFDLLEFQYRIE